MISRLNALIANARDEIDRCEQSITEIDNITGSLSIVVSSLDCVATKLEKGIVINGKPVGVDSINAKKIDIGNYNGNLSVLRGELSARMGSLNDDIARWEAEIRRIEAENAARTAAVSNANKSTVIVNGYQIH